MTARVKVQIAEAQLLAALQFIKKGVPGFSQSFRLRMAQINQVAVMGQYLFGQEACLLAGLFEGLAEWPD